MAEMRICKEMRHRSAGSTRRARVRQTLVAIDVVHSQGKVVVSIAKLLLGQVKHPSVETNHLSLETTLDLGQQLAQQLHSKDSHRGKVRLVETTFSVGTKCLHRKDRQRGHPSVQDLTSMPI